MQTYEFEGKTDEEAIEAACRQLNASRDDLDIEIIEPGSTGIFGLVGGKKAKIKVTVQSPEAPEALEPETVEIESPKAAQATEPENGEGVQVAKDALESILALIPMEGTTVTAHRSDGTINLKIDGDKSGLLIGRKGRTLDALQFIVNKIVNKSLEKRARVLVDSENYRQRRQEFLTQMAIKMGEKARRIKKPVTTNLLNPHDRRIVHLALRDDDGLETKGRGEGIMKKVVIIPKK